MHKVRSVMESSKKHPLEGLVNVDEFAIGGQEENPSGRSSNTSKTKVTIDVDLNEKLKVKRAYAKVITPLFEQHISEGARIFIDKWRGYNPLKKNYNIGQVPSNKGKNFRELHIIINKIKSWLRTVHAPVSKGHVKSYLDKYSYRLNRSQSNQTIFHNDITRMIQGKPRLHSQIISGN